MPVLTEEPDSPPQQDNCSARGPRRRVLVSAYAISPVRGSEPGMGWNICRRLADYHDVTVLCAVGMPGREHACYREEVERYLGDHGPVPGLTVRYVDRPAWSNLWQRERELFRRTLYYSGYKAWQRATYRLGRQLHAAHPFDLVHQLNMTGFREPGYLWKLDAPFVWGPIGGAADVPPAFFPLMSRQDRLFYRLRNFLNGVQKRTSRRCRAAARRAEKIWAIGEDNRRMAADRWGREAELLLESGAVERAGAAPKARRPGEPLRLVWSGLHIGRKALPVLLHALARLNGEPRAELAVLGEGPETARWRVLAQELGLGPRVRWTGMLPLEAALAEVARADVLAFTSVQEGTPHAVLEALSLGLPVVCHDACGMGAAVTDECGIKVRMESPKASIVGFADAIRRVAGDAELFHRLSAGALRRAAELSWDAKAKQIAEAYEQVIGSTMRAM